MPDVASLLNTADIAVLPSYREGTPRSLLEAAACSLPLVATDVPGCREIVRHNLNGFLVPAKDPTALANAILNLARDSALRNKMGRMSRKIVEEEFAEELVIENTISVYEHAFQER